jgi:CheY-like chemotaxis protein
MERAGMGSPLSRRPRVLIVDDEVLIGRVLARALGQFAEVAVARSGAEALEAMVRAREAGNEGFDLIVCDVMMPEMSGPALLDHVRAHHPAEAKAFVFVTGGASREEQEKIESTGAPCMQKPLDVEAIRALLNR